MKLILIIATLGIGTFLVLRRRNPELAERVEDAVRDVAKDAAGHLPDEAPGDIAGRIKDKAKGMVG